MGHQPFEDWILDNTKHTPQQEAILMGHLDECSSCNALHQSWKAVEAEMTASTMVAPLPGFTARWKTNLATEQAVEHQLQALKTFIGVGVAILITVGALFAWLVLTNSVSDVIVGGANVLTSITQAYFNLRGMVVQFLRHTPNVSPLLVWGLLAGWGVVLSSMWGLTIWRVSRQGVVHNEETN